MDRAAALGHKAILFANRPEYIGGVPALRDANWDRFWRAAEEAGLSINSHIGFGGFDPKRAAFGARPAANRTGREGGTADRVGIDLDSWSRAEVTKASALGLLSNSEQIAEVIISGVAHRFPGLNWVSVESGFGYVPYLLEALDWQWD